MHGQECCPELRYALHALGNRIADVMQLEIDEYLLAGVCQPPHQRQPPGVGELIANLVEGDAVAESRDHRLGGIDVWQIQRDDQPVSRIDSRWRHVTSYHALGKSISCRTRAPSDSMSAGCFNRSISS